MNEELFAKWLEETRKLQVEYFNTDPGALEGDELNKYLFVNTFATLDEMHEVAAEFSWKPWASANFNNRDQIINETVDALHFIANILVASKCSSEELNERYLAKMEKNRQRQRDGYTGRDKCPECTRAFDDVPRSELNPDLCEMCV